MKDFDCPHCGSENTQRVSILHSAGTQATSNSSLGLGLAGGHLGVGLLGQTGTTQSNLALQVSPPKEKQYPTGILVAFLLACLIVSMLVRDFAIFIIGTVCWLGITVVSAASVNKYNRTVFAEQMAEWRAKMICLRCGETFTA